MSCFKRALPLEQVTLEMEGGVHTAFCDPRRFGRVKQAADVAAELAHLGFDPILSMPALEDFTQMLSKERRGIKALLLDQVRHESMQLLDKLVQMLGQSALDGADLWCAARACPSQRANMASISGVRAWA